MSHAKQTVTERAALELHCANCAALGVLSFREWRKSIPCQDRNLMAYMTAVGAGWNDMMDAYSRAWHTMNLAEPVAA